MSKVSIACGDCATMITQAVTTLNRGSTVRDPGEPVCGPCNARRQLMVRQLDKLPSSLPDIVAMRMPR